MQEPLFPDPLLLVDDDAVHHRDLSGGAAKTQRRDAAPDTDGLSKRNTMIAAHRVSLPWLKKAWN